MVAKNLLDDVLALPPADKLELFERLRESLRDDPAADPTSEAHKRVLDERLDDLAANLDDAASWEEVEARVEQSLKGRA